MKKNELLKTRLVIYCGCASEDQKYLEELARHLAILEQHQSISLRKNAAVSTGRNWREEDSQLLKSAQIILFLVSVAFLSSPFHEQEIRQAISQTQDKKTPVIPILLRPVRLQGTLLDQLQPLPRNGKPIVQWKPRDEALTEIAGEISQIIWEYFLENRASPAQPFVSSSNLSAPVNPPPSSTLPLPTGTSFSAHSPLPINSQSAPTEGFTEPPVFNFMEIMVNPKLAQFSAREKRHRNLWNRRQSMAGGVAGLTWLCAIVLLFTSDLPVSPAWLIPLRFLMVITATVTIVYVLLLAQAYSAQRWQYYEQRRIDLNREKMLYQNNQGIYALSIDKQRMFMERFSQITQNVGIGTKSADETSDYV